MAHRISRLLAAGAVMATVAGGVSVGVSGVTAGASSSLKPITVGVLTDVTGPGSSGNATTVQGVQAGVELAKRDGYDLKYVVGDTATSPTTALTAGQGLVDQHHVAAVITVSAVAFGAAPFFKTQGTPVVGVAEDGPEWQTDTNMFSVYGIPKTSLVNTDSGVYFKSQGVTNLGSIGYAISPSSAEAAEGAAASAEHAGIKAGYVNAAFPFGSTNVAPIALAMKAAGVNGLSMSTDPNTAYALIDQLKLDGVHLKAVLLATGYGADVTNQASPAEAQAAQGVSFEDPYEVMELNTPATKQFAADLKAAGIKGLPTESEYNAYVAVGMLVQALKKAGSNPTQAEIITQLSKIHTWDALGLFGNYPINLANRTNFSGHCFWVGKLVGKNFELVKGAEPLCGNTIPGVTVSPPT
jgi:ABC-type branched-subunit amino acid transport system substrate-binding protein